MIEKLELNLREKFNRGEICINEVKNVESSEKC